MSGNSAQNRPDPSFDTVQLNDCVRRWQAGSNDAADELCRAVARRLEHLARRMLKSYPSVRQGFDTMDVLQGALVRLLNTLRKITPPSTRDFFNLAANHVRRELIDLARHLGRRVTLQPVETVASEGPLATVPPSDELELWSRFHEAVENLDAEYREVFSLAFYHDWTQPRIAELLGVNERTVRRHWQAAVLSLNEQLGGQLPPL